MQILSIIKRVSPIFIALLIFQVDFMGADCAYGETLVNGEIVAGASSPEKDIPTDLLLEENQRFVEEYQIEWDEATMEQKEEFLVKIQQEEERRKTQQARREKIKEDKLELERREKERRKKEIEAEKLKREKKRKREQRRRARERKRKIQEMKRRRKNVRR